VRTATGKSVRLHELAYACRLYAAFTDFDRSITEFRNVVGPALDLGTEIHRHALLRWLNSWGCRQFEKKDHPLASDELKEWAGRYMVRLPPPHQGLAELSEDALDEAAEAYGDLKGRRASARDRGSRSHPVTFGATGAAKGLYAFRPEALPPWDDPIRRHFCYDGSLGSYRQFLSSVQDQVRVLVQEADQFGIPASEIPKIVGRGDSSLPKLVDEYFWVTITKNCAPPSKEEFECWLRWARGHAAH